MADSLDLRNPGDALVDGLKRRAVRHGRSAEAEHRESLRQPLSRVSAK
jgi:plasmid stability protein